MPQTTKVGAFRLISVPYESVTLTRLISAPSDLTRENFQIVADTISRWNFRSCREMSTPVTVVPTLRSQHTYSIAGVQP
jgi:hypothetical protein